MCSLKTTKTTEEIPVMKETTAEMVTAVAAVKELIGTDTAFPEDVLPVVIDGRRFGQPMAVTDAYEQPVPAVFARIAEETADKSRLLAIPKGTTDKQTLFQAYKSDLALLEGRLNDFEHMVKAAVRHSIVLAQTSAKLEDIWPKLEEKIPPIGREALLALRAEDAAKPAAALAAHLKEEFSRGLARVVRRMAHWLQIIVEHEFVGIVGWTAPDVCKYFYFVRTGKRSVISQKEKNTTEVDPTVRYGRQTTYTRAVERIVNITEDLERHTHHLVNAKCSRLSEFVLPLPPRVKEFLESVPSWIAPHLEAVSGDITMEQILRRKVGEDMKLETEIISVFKASPAISLGGFALIGWSESDLEKEGRVFSPLQTAQGQVIKKGRRRDDVLLALGITTAAVIFAGLITWIAISQIRSGKAAFAAYRAEIIGAKTVHGAAKGQVIELPGKQEVRYAGYEEVWNTILLVVGNTIEPLMVDGRYVTPVLHRYRLTGKGYGTVDLSPLGVFVNLHIIEAKKNSIRYVVTPYQK